MERPKRSPLNKPVLESADHRLSESLQELSAYVQENQPGARLVQPEKRSGLEEHEKGLIVVLARAVLELKDEVSNLKRRIDGSPASAPTDGKVGFPLSRKEREEN